MYRYNMAKEFPELRLCENGWKADQIATDNYSGWRGLRDGKDKVKKESNPKQESTDLSNISPIIDATAPINMTAPINVTAPTNVTAPIDATAPIDVTAPTDMTASINTTAPLNATVSPVHKRKPSLDIGQDTIKKARVADTIDVDGQENEPVDNTGDCCFLFGQHAHAVHRQCQREFYHEYTEEFYD